MLGSIYLNSPDIVHKQVQLLNAQIPYSFYVINYSNQLFRCKLGEGAITTYTIPVGNYTATSLIAAIKTAVADANLTITISNINGKLTFTHTVSIIIYNNFQYSIGTILGLDANVNGTIATSYTPPNPLNLLGIKTLQIRSANLIMNNVSSVEGGQTTLLANIPVSAVPFGMIEYTDKGNLISISNPDLDDIAIELIDGETGNLINMNGQDWCVTLAFHLTKIWTPPFTPNLQNAEPAVEPTKPAEPAVPLVKQEPPPQMHTLPGLGSVDEQQLSFLQS